MRTIFWSVVALLAWCGGMWSNVRTAKQLEAAGHSVWTLNLRARLIAWKGANIAIFLISSTIFVSAVLIAAFTP